MITGTLTPDEIALGVDVGSRRDWDFRRRGARDRHFAANRSGQYRLSVNMLGAIAELVVCKSRGCYWPGTVEFVKTDPDIPPDIQVRATERDDGSLIVHDDDPPDHRYVLVILDIPRYSVVGWIRGRDAMRAEWWRDPTGKAPAYFVPQSALNPLGEP